jgi:4-diphosphocytidyl-2-C-methyl-D-erythritol kinase
VNLHLSVGPRRSDGFHELVTVFHAVDLYDEVVASAAEGLSLTLSGEGADELPTDDRNLSWRAAELLARTAGVAADVHLELRKAIPVAGGMAGGSADAAATLVACARLWHVDTDVQELAAQLGSDVAFPLVGGTAIGTGRGELLRPAPDHPPMHWVFALADAGISAASAYGELDRQRESGIAAPPAGELDELLAALGTGDAYRIAGALANDLQPAALTLQPALAKTLDAGREAGALAAIVSGSGPTCAFLCTDAAAAQRIADELESVCRAARVASGPAQGATVLA